jgi:hypothetical protein
MLYVMSTTGPEGPLKELTSWRQPKYNPTGVAASIGRSLLSSRHPIKHAANWPRSFNIVDVEHEEELERGVVVARRPRLAHGENPRLSDSLVTPLDPARPAARRFVP